MTDHIIKSLNPQLLTDWGFKFELMEWIHPNYPFKLISSKSGYQVKIKTDRDDVTLDGSTISTNGELLRLITEAFSIYLPNVLKSTPVLGHQSQLKLIKDTINSYFSFDSNLKFNLYSTPDGPGLIPNNEYTYTMISNMECSIEVTYKTDSIHSEIIYINPGCISYNYLTDRYPNSHIESVRIETVDGKWEPFFGIGIPKVTETNESN